MQSVIHEITQLRNGNMPAVDLTNTNRYRIVANELDGSKTAYYFSAPIYNVKSRKLIDMKFYRDGNTFYSVGSNASITFGSTVRMENAEGHCNVTLPLPLGWVSDKILACRGGQIFNTTNGFACKIPLYCGSTFAMETEVSQSCLQIRANDRCFAYMSDRYRPFICCSCIGTLNEAGRIIAPAKLTYERITNQKYRLTYLPCSPMGKWLLFEINMYEPKLFQDTTVESKNPQTNNAYGTTGFIGNSAVFGEQWLYTRPDFSKLQDIGASRVRKAILHIPKWNHSGSTLTAYKLASRFCSFGSTWENRVPATASTVHAEPSAQYFDMDITPFLTDSHGRLSSMEGFILKSQKKSDCFSAISTGDSSYAPQILEIRYK